MKPSTPLKRAAGVTAVLVGLPVAGAEIPLLGSPPRRWDRRSRRISAVRSSRLPGSWWTLRGGPGNPRGRAGAGGAGGGLRSIRRGAFGASQLRPGGARLYWWNRTPSSRPACKATRRERVRGGSGEERAVDLEDLVFKARPQRGDPQWRPFRGSKFDSGQNLQGLVHGHLVPPGGELEISPRSAIENAIESTHFFVRMVPPQSSGYVRILAEVVAVPVAVVDLHGFAFGLRRAHGNRV